LRAAARRQAGEQARLRVVELDRRAVQPHGFVELAAIAPHVGELRQRADRVRIAGQRALGENAAPARCADALVRATDVEQGLGVVGRELERLLELGQRGIDLALGEVDAPELLWSSGELAELAASRSARRRRRFVTDVTERAQRVVTSAVLVSDGIVPAALARLPVSCVAT